jgi:hypothetical protein
VLFDQRTSLIRERVEAELPPTASEVGIPGPQAEDPAEPTAYGRFAPAVDAIRFAIEEQSHELLLTAQLKVAEKRSTEFAGYESAEYSLTRAGERMRQPNDLSERRETPMKVRPHSRAVVKRIEAEDETANGIIISPNAGNK